MNQNLPIFDELNDARSPAAAARALVTISLEVTMTYQDAIRRICHSRHFPKGADYVDNICTVMRAPRLPNGQMSDKAEELFLFANEEMLRVIAEEGEGGVRPLRVLVGCETSGMVRNAFLRHGHDAWSCDLLPADDRSNRHIICDIRELLNDQWDLLAVMHPPCTRLCNSGVRWLSEPPGRLNATYSAEIRAAYQEWRREERLAFMWGELDKGAALFSDCWNAPIERIAIENPVMHRYAKERIRNYQPPAQTVQPWWFGDEAFKGTSFYLKNLEPLVATERLTPPKAGTDVHKRWSQVHRASPGEDRWKIRSKTYPGIAEAMPVQWGAYAMEKAA